ncbi:MAG: gluconate 2-dehydrogenase subunit 3 family protein [Pseudomonadales bacterium]
MSHLQPPDCEKLLEDGVFTRPGVDDDYCFTEFQRQVLDAVQMQLFPEDGDGPAARDINALPYLELAMTDPVNVDDGDPDFIGRGIKWLDGVSRKTHAVGFVELSGELQNEVLERIAQSKFGKNWLSLLMYYLTEALMLDPFYGGNPDMVGWLWLDHRPGFPRPVEGKSYRDFK